MARSRGSSAMVFDEKCGMVMVGAVNDIEFFIWCRLLDLVLFQGFSNSLRSESRLLGVGSCLQKCEATRDLGGIF